MSPAVKGFGMKAGLDGRRTGMVVTARRFGAGVFLGWMVPRLRGGALTLPYPLRQLATWDRSPGLRIPPPAGAGGPSFGALAAGVGATFATGAGVGAEVLGVEDGLSCPPAIAIFSTSSKKAEIVIGSMPDSTLTSAPLER